MVLRRHTLDLVEGFNEIDERLSEIDERKEQIKDEAVANREDGESITDLEDEWHDISLEEADLNGQRMKFLDAIVAYSTGHDVTHMDRDEVEEVFHNEVTECVFEVQELSYGQLQAISDDMLERSFEVDVQRQDIKGMARQGSYQIEVLRTSIQSWPEFAPTRTRNRKEMAAPEQYPIPVSEWLYERIDSLNTSGDVQLGNSSLEDELR